MFTVLASQEKGPGSSPGWEGLKQNINGGLFVWSLHGLPVHAWVLSGQPFSYSVCVVFHVSLTDVCHDCVLSSLHCWFHRLIMNVVSYLVNESGPAVGI